MSKGKAQHRICSERHGLRRFFYRQSRCFLYISGCISSAEEGWFKRTFVAASQRNYNERQDEVICLEKRDLGQDLRPQKSFQSIYFRPFLTAITRHQAIRCIFKERFSWASGPMAGAVWQKIILALRVDLEQRMPQQTNCLDWMCKALHSQIMMRVN